MVRVKRRFHVQRLRTGFVDLDIAEAHHIRDVLRLTEGTSLELFDDDGQLATGLLVMVNSSAVRVEIHAIEVALNQELKLTVAAAIPKGDRADWMIEKLTELGVDRFIPLAAERSVVLPGGRNKIERWGRIALEAAKQSRRAGMMKIAELTPLHRLVSELPPDSARWFLSTTDDATPIRQKLNPVPKNLALLIGPEGGWTQEEMRGFGDAGLEGVGLTKTVLRLETAAVAAASVVLCNVR
jgi:16S rRNA (uracil1498-N3)-methyltransferase